MLFQANCDTRRHRSVEPGDWLAAGENRDLFSVISVLRFTGHTALNSSILVMNGFACFVRRNDARSGVANGSRPSRGLKRKTWSKLGHERLNFHYIIVPTETIAAFSSVLLLRCHYLQSIQSFRRKVLLLDLF